MANRLIAAFGIGLASALVATWAHGMTSGQSKAVFAYAVLMTLSYAGASRRWGSRAKVAGVAFVVTLPVILVAVRVLGHDAQYWARAAVAGAALAAGVALGLSSRAAPTTDRHDNPA